MLGTLSVGLQICCITDSVNSGIFKRHAFGESSTRKFEISFESSIDESTFQDEITTGNSEE